MYSKLKSKIEIWFPTKYTRKENDKWSRGYVHYGRAFKDYEIISEGESVFEFNYVFKLYERDNISSYTIDKCEVKHGYIYFTISVNFEDDFAFYNQQNNISIKDESLKRFISYWIESYRLSALPGYIYHLNVIDYLFEDAALTSENVLDNMYIVYSPDEKRFNYRHTQVKENTTLIQRSYMPLLKADAYDVFQCNDIENEEYWVDFYNIFGDLILDNHKDYYRFLSIQKGIHGIDGYLISDNIGVTRSFNSITDLEKLKVFRCKGRGDSMNISPHLKKYQIVDVFEEVNIKDILRDTKEIKSRKYIEFLSKEFYLKNEVELTEQDRRDIDKCIRIILTNDIYSLTSKIKEKIKTIDSDAFIIENMLYGVVYSKENPIRKIANRINIRYFSNGRFDGFVPMPQMLGAFTECICIDELTAIIPEDIRLFYSLLKRGVFVFLFRGEIYIALNDKIIKY